MPGVKDQKIRLAPVWLSGCSGCHMSFLDMDEHLLELQKLVHLVFSPLADHKCFPEGVDVVLVEGAVANTEHLALAQTLRGGAVWWWLWEIAPSRGMCPPSATVWTPKGSCRLCMRMESAFPGLTLRERSPSFSPLSCPCIG